jgi:hypothetical protein
MDKIVSYLYLQLLIWNSILFFEKPFVKLQNKLTPVTFTFY